MLLAVILSTASLDLQDYLSRGIATLAQPCEIEARATVDAGSGAASVNGRKRTLALLCACTWRAWRIGVE